MGVSKFLKSGMLRINSADKVLELEGIAQTITYDELKSSDWGYVYEKHVGQILESEGYEVSYNGLNLGFLDKGIDLIARKDSTISFIQCKYYKGRISRKGIEWILFKASNELFKKWNQEKKRLIFILVVNCIDDNFSKIIPRGFNISILQSSNVKYPLLQYFLYHNNTQDKVKLEIREITMNK